jgi:hydroxypyruvate reductase
MNKQNKNSPRAQLLQIFSDALKAVDGEQVVANHLQQLPESDMSLRVVAIGKAAGAMARGAARVLARRIEAGLIITKYGHSEPVLCTQPHWQCLEAGHPYPDQNSLEAGKALLEFVDTAGEQSRFLFLISGGSSALVEVLPDGMSLADLEQLNRELLHRSLNIEQINRVRQALSCIKGGRLGSRLRGRPALQLAISDVPGDAAHIIGSGLLVPSPAPPPKLEHPWSVFQARVPPPPATALDNVDVHIIANNAQARRAAAASAERLGWSVQEDAELHGALEEASQTIVQTLNSGAPGVYLWGGETHLDLPPQPGRGGRCQSLALRLAMALRDCPPCLVLAAGTDGTDGPTGDAGAVVDSQSVARGEGQNLDAEQALRDADAGRFLEQSGDLVHTGPTGTNVMDLIIALKLPD